MKFATRDKTKRIKIGNIYIGGSNNVLIQSMCNIKTSKVDEVVKQINECARLGADIMRVSVLDFEDAASIKQIVSKIKIPLIADIHFDYRLAIESVKNGASVIRINPGNIGTDDKVEEVVKICKKQNVPIRIGVNSGSIDKTINDNTDKVNAKELVKSASKMVKLLENHHFYDIVISLKGSNVKETVEAYRLAAKKFKYPLHLGITEAGPSSIGIIRSTAGLAPLLLDGIGDTIRISLSDEPEEEVRACRRLLKDLEIRNDYPTLISCPTCGRTQVNLVPLAKQVLKYLEENHINKTIAIMGCIVNGPGEAKRADLGCAGGKEQWVIFKGNTFVKQVKEKDIFNELIREINKL